MNADVQRIRREHIRRTRVQRLTTGHGYDICARCRLAWPCDAARLLERLAKMECLITKLEVWRPLQEALYDLDAETETR